MNIREIRKFAAISAQRRRRRHAAAAAASFWPRRSEPAAIGAETRSLWRGKESPPGFHKAEAAEEAAKAGVSDEIQPSVRVAGSPAEATVGGTSKIRGKRQITNLATSGPQGHRLQSMREALRETREFFAQGTCLEMVQFCSSRCAQRISSTTGHRAARRVSFAPTRVRRHTCENWAHAAAPAAL